MLQRRASIRALAGAVTVAALLLAPRASAGSAAIAATVYSTPTGRPLPTGFVGVSLEYDALPSYSGHNPSALDPVFETLIRNLAPGQSPVLRIGGDSTDATWRPVGGMVRPGGITYSLTAEWLRSTRSLASALGAQMITGVNLAADRPRLAAGEARALLSGIGRAHLSAFEIGNEPDLYNVFPWHRGRNGRLVFARGKHYDANAFIRDFARWRAALPPAPLAGPAVAEPTWLAHLGRLLSTEPRLAIVTAHRYPLRACITDPSSPSFASIPNLLRDRSASGLAESIAPYVALAHSRGRAFRVDEVNSASCRGKQGVSDTFASALWVLDTLFDMAKVGVDGVNIHSLPGAHYELFTVRRSGGEWHAFVRPDYYGLLMFGRAFPPGASRLRVSAPPGPVKVWATISSDRHTRVLMINKDMASPHQLRVRVPGAGATGAARLEWLLAPSVSATSGVTLGGQTFGAQTSTGILPPPRTQSLMAAGGLYKLTLPAASAVLLTQ